MNCDVDEMMESCCQSFCRFTQSAQLILQPFRCFTYVTAHSPTHPSSHLRHRHFTYITWSAVLPKPFAFFQVVFILHGLCMSCVCHAEHCLSCMGVQQAVVTNFLFKKATAVFIAMLNVSLLVFKQDYNQVETVGRTNHFVKGAKIPALLSRTVQFIINSSLSSLSSSLSSSSSSSLYADDDDDK